MNQLVAFMSLIFIDMKSVFAQQWQSFILNFRGLWLKKMFKMLLVSFESHYAWEEGNLINYSD